MLHSSLSPTGVCAPRCSLHVRHSGQPVQQGKNRLDIVVMQVCCMRGCACRQAVHCIQQRGHGSMAACERTMRTGYTVWHNLHTCANHRTCVQTKDKPELSLPAPPACVHLGDALTGAAAVVLSQLLATYLPGLADDTFLTADADVFASAAGVHCVCVVLVLYSCLLACTAAAVAGCCFAA